jgi:hypothetical protein
VFAEVQQASSCMGFHSRCAAGHGFRREDWGGRAARYLHVYSRLRHSQSKNNRTAGCLTCRSLPLFSCLPTPSGKRTLTPHRHLLRHSTRLSKLAVSQFASVFFALLSYSGGLNCDITIRDPALREYQVVVSWVNKVSFTTKATKTKSHCSILSRPSL